MSFIPPKADIRQREWYVRLVPIVDMAIAEWPKRRNADDVDEMYGPASRRPFLRWCSANFSGRVPLAYDPLGLGDSNGFSWRETPQCMLADDALIFMKSSLGWNRFSIPTFVLYRLFQLSLAHRRKPGFPAELNLMKEFSYAYRADRAAL